MKFSMVRFVDKKLSFTGEMTESELAQAITRLPPQQKDLINGLGVGAPYSQYLLALARLYKANEDNHFYKDVSEASWRNK